ncbi:MAG: enoyl-CoA hydratase [Leucothrix sp.]
MTSQTTDTHAIASEAAPILLQETTQTGVLRLTLNDAKRRNALSDEMMSTLGKALDNAASDGDVRVIVLAAHGPAFCAGHDLKQIRAGREADDKGLAYFTKVFANCATLMQKIVNHPKPIIAEVTGIATAAGCQLVASCDLAVAAKSSRFATPGVHIGLFCSTPMVALSRNVSNKHAMEMLMAGDMLPAKRAAKIGLINQAVKDKKLRETTMALADKIASKSSMTLAVGKQAFYQQRDMPLADAYQYASDVMVQNLLKQDAIEGINAFVEKRKPEWTDQ